LPVLGLTQDAYLIVSQFPLTHATISISVFELGTVEVAVVVGVVVIDVVVGTVFNIVVVGKTLVATEVVAETEVEGNIEVVNSDVLVLVETVVELLELNKWLKKFTIPCQIELNMESSYGWEL
jgi:hypothetical protein